MAANDAPGIETSKKNYSGTILSAEKNFGTVKWAKIAYSGPKMSENHPKNFFDTWDGARIIFLGVPMPGTSFAAILGRFPGLCYILGIFCPNSDSPLAKTDN